MQRRSVLTGLGALSLAGCSRAEERAPASRDVHLDFTALEARHGGRVGLCASDGGNRVSWRADERFATASSFKLFLAAAVLERAARGEERLDRPVAIRRADILSHSPVTEPAVGGILTVEQLCAAVIETSDNAGANLLLDIIGGPAGMTDYYRSLGDTVSRSDRTELALNSAIAGDPRDTTTPDASVHNLRTLLLTDRLAPADRARLERWMVDSTPGANRIKAAAPANWRIGHKTGTGQNGATIDIGVLWPPAATPIVMAVYFTEAPGLTVAQREAVIADAARLALRTLGHD